jgi:hypothetical protein
MIAVMPFETDLMNDVLNHFTKEALVVFSA